VYTLLDTLFWLLLVLPVSTSLSLSRSLAGRGMDIEGGWDRWLYNRLVICIDPGVALAVKF
jgi:hypothetical protein